MSAYIKFTNKSTHPIISVFSDDLIIAEDILKNSTSKMYHFNSGTIEFTLKENHNKKIQSLWLSLYPGKSYELIMKNNNSFLINV